MRKMRKKLMILTAILFMVALSVPAFMNLTRTDQGFGEMGAVLAKISAPEIKGKTYPITDFGAVEGGELCTEAIQKAIEVCAANGGGTVLVPKGIFFTGPIHLKSNINLHLEENAVLRFTTDPQAYLPVVKTRWEGIDCYNYSPLIYANNCENISITGKGTLDGQADETNWWPWKGKPEYGWKEGMPSQLDPGARPKLGYYEENRVPIEKRIMGEGHYLRPEFIVAYECRNVLIEDITIRNAPFWLIHPVYSENIIVRRVKAISHGPNNDGCNPESCRNVLIEDCFFNTGDDCIAIKSGRNNDGRDIGRPSENIIIRNCIMENGHGGVVIGSEISGGCRNIFVENCTMSSPELERAIRIKTNSLRGGEIENLYFRNITVGEVKESVIKINCLYEMKDQEQGEHIPWIRDIYISGLKSSSSEYALDLTGVPGYHNISNIHLEDCHFSNVKKDNVIKGVKNLTLRNTWINNKDFTGNYSSEKDLL
jgi:polygalacturonase